MSLTAGVVGTQQQRLRVDPLPLRMSPTNASLAVLGMTYLFAVRVALEPLRCVDLNGRLVVASDTSLPCAITHAGKCVCDGGARSVASRHAPHPLNQ